MYMSRRKMVQPGVQPVCMVSHRGKRDIISGISFGSCMTNEVIRGFVAVTLMSFCPKMNIAVLGIIRRVKLLLSVIAYLSASWWTWASLDLSSHGLIDKMLMVMLKYALIEW